MAYGSIAHAVCESVEWIDDWKPDEAALVARATALAPFFTPEKIQASVAHVVKQLRAGKIAASLSRPKDSAVAVRERQFLHFNEGGGLRQGAIDRIVLHGKPGAWTRIEIVDFKTDRPLVEGEANWSTSRADHHRPQLHAYREAVAAEYNVDPKIISTWIVLLSSGEVIAV
jgi:ATP-dependent exoDNAse (exonuclease V) beta subunit